MTGDTDVVDAPAAAPVKDKDAGETPEDALRRARKPPAEGPCKGCGKDLPLNRLMLCYRCWVHKQLMDEARSRGADFIPTIDAHPAWCACTLPEHARPGSGGAGGN